MSRKARPLLTPGWLFGDVAVLAMVVTMVLLGRWQLDVSNSKHFDLQNFGYSLQWWAFSIFAIVMWIRVLRDARRRAAEPDERSSQQAEAIAAAAEPVAYRRYVMPNSTDASSSASDPELAAYNDYLAQLAEHEHTRDGEETNR